ncbi:RCC1 domain-containing protein 1-like [Pristis pectinata]|uniref:RCC1 domain-containing protein 1-like n=1 Tax=Pristis pectinata TaxID=685728 RepID=UPI00223DFD60|nr:RCC1 domain-containing protein 1-like [Pristis pectinata]
MAAPAPADTGRWFGFGFNLFGQTVNGVEPAGGPVLEPREVTACNSRPDRGSSAPAARPEAGGDSEPATNGGARPSPRPRQRVTACRVSPAWSHSACLTDDGSVYFWGFVAGGPWHQMYINNQDLRGCEDILSSEKYLLTLWRDRVQCWDISSLSRTREATDAVVWTKHLQEEEKPNAAFPLIPGGYITTTPPFYKSLSPLLHARKLVLGSEHALLLTFDWTVYSWGSGRHGQLGHGSVEDEVEPRIVEALHGLAMAELAAGAWHSVCASASGDLYVWGWNESGQLGLPAKSCSGDEHQKLSQQTGLSGEGVPALSDAGDKVKKSTTDKAAVGNTNVFISIQAFPALLDFPGELEISKVSCGARHTAAVTRSGKLFTWGWGNYGQLGHGQTDSTDLPRLVEYFIKNHLSVLDIVCGPWNTFAFAQGKNFKS